MKHPLKLMIQKKKELDEFKHFRYYNVERLILDDYSPIKTEAQLCYYIYKRFGTGRYMILAFQKGVTGFWCFWLGDLRDNGFIRDLRKNKEVEKLQKELVNATEYEERENIEEEIDFEREIDSEIKKLTRRGPIGLIKSRPGQLNEYQTW